MEKDRTLLEEDVTKAMEEYEEKVKEIKTEISGLRKEGRDMLIADLMLKNADAKMKWARINKKPDDFERIEDILKDTQDEVKDAAGRNLVNVKKEVLDRVDKEIQIEKEQRVMEEKTVPEEKSEIDKKILSEPEQESVIETIVEKEDEQEHMELEKKNKFENKKMEFAKLVTDPSKQFRLSCGHIMVSLNDFIGKIQFIPDECFKYHMRDYENDFSKWIVGVFKDYNLAKKIKGASSRQELLNILERDKRGE